MSIPHAPPGAVWVLIAFVPSVNPTHHVGDVPMRAVIYSMYTIESTCWRTVHRWKDRQRLYSCVPLEEAERIWPELFR